MKGSRGVATGVALASATLVNGLYQNGSSITPCDSPIYCRGEILKQIELARPFTDSKTFVDMPTRRPLDEVIAAFDRLSKPLSNNTELNDFLSTYFGEAGSELEEVPPEDLETDAAFLDRIEDSVIREFTQQVVDIWPDLTRSYVGSRECDGCVDSYIPIRRNPFVIVGGRFREPYYWDSYWTIEGLLRTGGSFTQISRNMIENFLDLVEEFGFIPNAFRIYYLNRSQPPLLTQMVKIYVDYTNDTSILERAVPLLVREHEFWVRNRTVEISSDGTTYSLAHYSVINTEPRPESYREDYITANNQSYYAQSGIIYPEVRPLNDSEKATLYANLASGAESGWDYTSRWLTTPTDAADDVYFPLRSLNTREIIPVDINSILYANEMTIAGYLNESGDSEAAADFEELARNRSAAMYALMWNEEHGGYFDYNLTSAAQNLYVPADADATPAERRGAPEGYEVAFNAAQFYPFWLGAAPAHLRDNPLAVRQAYARVAAMLDEEPGAVAATNHQTAQQWDEPNVWPPLIYALVKGLLNTPATHGDTDPSYAAVRALALRIAQRYLDSTFCTWRATGGSTSELPRLGDDVLGEDHGDDARGVMFEKYSNAAIDAAGSGGEYEVVEGFGWTNGVLIWIVDTFGNDLRRPECGDLSTDDGEGDGDANGRKKLRRRRRNIPATGPSAVELSPVDARWIKKFGRRSRN
ncbi:hypothetical protein DL768_000451 [Monosporascus sp. mg162]|nr:hypothetical protein DL768_000451 [Monosporascus sp. mg162]